MSNIDFASQATHGRYRIQCRASFQCVRTFEVFGANEKRVNKKVWIMIVTLRSTSFFFINYLMISMVQSFNTPACLNGLHDFKLKHYQAVIFHENLRNNHSSNDEISKILCTNIACIQINDNASTTHPIYQLPSIKIARPKTLFVIISSENAFIRKTIDSLAERLWSAHDQQILIVSSTTEYEDLLLYAWKRQFADVTFLQVTGKLASNETWLIRQYNPFTGKYTAANCTNETQWFPDRMENLHGFDLKVGMLSFPPYSNIVRNSTGHVMAKSGSDVMLLEFLAHAMNFNPVWIPWKGNNTYGKRDETDPARISDYLRELLDHNLDVIANHHKFKLQAEKVDLFEHSRSLYINKYRIVVPIIHCSSDSKFLMAVVGGIVISVIIIFARLCNFNAKLWTPDNVFCVILGFSATEKPKKFAEMIIFMSLVIFSLIYSNFFYDEIVENAMKTTTEVQLNELKDLVHWQLTPMGDFSIIPVNILEIEDDRGNIQNFSIKDSVTQQTCLEMLVEHKNVACIMSRYDARINEISANLGRSKPILKLMIPNLFMAYPSMALVKGSPYVRKFNKKLEIVRQAGIDVMLEKRDIGYFIRKRQPYTSLNNEQITDIKYFGQLLKFICAVYILPILIFLIELVIGVVYFFKKRNPKLINNVKDAYHRYIRK